MRFSVTILEKKGAQIQFLSGGYVREAIFGQFRSLIQPETRGSNRTNIAAVRG
jgi:hypothetical protein